MAGSGRSGDLDETLAAVRQHQRGRAAERAAAVLVRHVVDPRQNQIEVGLVAAVAAWLAREPVAFTVPGSPARRTLRRRRSAIGLTPTA
jgi:hypothetical protein